MTAGSSFVACQAVSRPPPVYLLFSNFRLWTCRRRDVCCVKTQQCFAEPFCVLWGLSRVFAESWCMMCNQCPAGVFLPAVMPNLGLIVEDFPILNREQYAEIARAYPISISSAHCRNHIRDLTAIIICLYPWWTSVNMSFINPQLYLKAQINLHTARIQHQCRSTSFERLRGKWRGAATVLTRRAAQWIVKC